MGIIAITFVVTMGWVGLSAPTSDAVAKVNDQEISLNEYRRSYQNAIEFYRNLFKDGFNEDLVKQLNLRRQVMNNLIDHRIWLDYARSIGLEVTDEEVLDVITKTPGFQQKGQFNPEIYRRILSANRLTPELYEKAHREELLVEKAKDLVRQSVALTDQEMQPPTIAQTASSQPNAPNPKDLLKQKQERALFAFTEALKAKARIDIKKEFLEEHEESHP
jgi:peptidyl-prolyl cis-trans isomerase D